MYAIEFTAALSRVLTQPIFMEVRFRVKVFATTTVMAHPLQKPAVCLSPVKNVFFFITRANFELHINIEHVEQIQPKLSCLFSLQVRALGRLPRRIA